VQFKIMDIRSGDGGTIAYLSRRAAQEECAACYISHLERGDIIPARITHLEPFGAFCDIGCGLVSLLTVDKISVSRISHPSDRFRVGEFTSVVVHSTSDSGRIYLTHRELLGTWEENAAGFEIGQTVAGVVRSIESYGIFVELAPNLAGLAEWKAGVEVGQCASVYIKNILPAKKKVKLVLVDAYECEKSVSAPKYYITEGNVADWRY
jgi:small subunit ribosomal protein S1